MNSRKTIYFLGAAVSFIIAISEIVPTYLIGTGLLQGSVVEGDENIFLGKFFLHSLYLISFTLLGIFLVRKARNIRMTSEEKSNN